MSDDQKPNEDTEARDSVEAAKAAWDDARAEAEAAIAKAKAAEQRYNDLVSDVGEHDHHTKASQDYFKREDEKRAALAAAMAEAGMTGGAMPRPAAEQVSAIDAARKQARKARPIGGKTETKAVAD